MAVTSAHLCLLACALASLACAPFASQARPWAPVEAELHAWVQRDAVALTGPTGALDMTPLCEALADAPVIALGESSHGVHELKDAQLALIRCVAERPGPATILFELSYDFVRELDAYVRDAAPLPAMTGGNLVETRELIATLTWIRDHNRRVAPEERVRLGGLDIWCWAECVDQARDYIAAVDPPRAAAIDATLAPLRADAATIAADAGASVRAALEQLLAHLVAHRDDYQRTGDPDAWADAHHRITLALAHVDNVYGPFYAQDRDRVMADNVAWFRDSGQATDPLLVIAHSGHVAADPQRLPNGRRNAPSMGEHLRHRLGRAYVAVHMTFHSGRFLAYRAGRLGAADPGFANALAVFPAPAPAPGTLEALLGADEARLLDLRRLPPRGPVAAWFAWEQFVRSLPAAWRPAFGRAPFASLGWTGLAPAHAFDLVVQVPRASPIAPL